MTTSNNNNNDDASQQFCVRWNSHLGSLGAAFPQLLAGQQFVDVTLACEGHQLHCHRLVLAACSSFFESLLGESPCKHPIIILPRDIKLWEIQALVDFMYKGEVNVSQAGLTDLLKCAEILQIRGLSGNNSSVNLNTIKYNTTTTTTVDNNLMQNELLSTNNNNVGANQQQQQQKIETNNTIVSETQQVQSSIDNKLITQLNNSISSIGSIPISTLSNNLPIISSISSADNNVNSNILSINSSKFTKLLTDTNTLVYHQEKNNSIDENIIKNNDISNDEEIILSRDKNIKNQKEICLQNNFNSDITTAAKNPSSITTTAAIINNNNNSSIFDSCKINKIDKLPLFKKVSLKHENVQKNNIECGNSNSKTVTADIIPFVIPKTEPFDTSIYDESIDDTILNEDETDLMNIDNKSNNDDFPLSNVVCEYDSNGLQINMETPGRRVRRSEAILRQAAECVSKGQTFQTVSDMFSIPISTIRFFMARKGILPRRKRGRTAGMTVIGSNVVSSGIGGNIRNSTIGENNNNSSNNLTLLENSRSASPLEPPFHFATYKLPELKPKLL